MRSVGPRSGAPTRRGEPGTEDVGYSGEGHPGEDAAGAALIASGTGTGQGTPPAPARVVLTGGRVERLVRITQKPIGRSPRSTLATYTGAMDRIRSLFAATDDAKERGYGAGRFSFNTTPGRCPTCEGQGSVSVELLFMPSVYAPCPSCHGQRFTLFRRQPLIRCFQLLGRQAQLLHGVDGQPIEAVGGIDDGLITALFDVRQYFIDTGLHGAIGHALPVQQRIQLTVEARLSGREPSNGGSGCLTHGEPRVIRQAAIDVALRHFPNAPVAV